MTDVIALGFVHPFFNNSLMLKVKSSIIKNLEGSAGFEPAIGLVRSDRLTICSVRPLRETALEL